MKRLLILWLCLGLLAATPMDTLAAPDWPSDVQIEAEGGIVMDADTGAVLYGKAIHGQFHPASITKVMTALLVLEKCENLEEEVVFSNNAVYNVEAGSTNAGISPGEILTVKDCLYALMLKSANESANAMAEHFSGDIETFAKEMTEKAVSLGCQNTNFANPSGLNDPNNYTSPYDMALIAKAAFENPTFVEIVSTSSYRLPPTQKDPEGLVISSNHRMTKPNDELYYPGIIGGKTGFTSLTGNTLVTCVEKDGLKLIAVVLKGSQPQYWWDTKALLDFGFGNFQSVEIAQAEATYRPEADRLNIAGLTDQQAKGLELAPGYQITLPKNAEFTDADVAISYDLTESDLEHAVAKLTYTYRDRVIGTGYLRVKGEVVNSDQTLSQTEPTQTQETAPVTDSAATVPSQEVNQPPKEQKQGLSKGVKTALLALGATLAVAAIIGVLVFLRIRASRREEELRRQRRERRQKRLSEEGMTMDFEALMEQRRQGKK